MWLCSSVWRIDVIATLGREFVVIRRDDADERFAVRADEVAEATRKLRQPRRIFAHLEEQRHRPHHAAGEDDLVGVEIALRPDAAERVFRFDDVAATASWAHGEDLRLGAHFDPRFSAR